MQVERVILDAIGLSSPLVEIETNSTSEKPSPKDTTVSIHDFGKYLSENEPPPRNERK
ncbi:hypothetical protein COO91_08333 [Nostoc flagelliforme CCNUN1]|uniref:Uncharacterized protein n=1 Tax=Nostoc flagelliforme CCNUN1 TaxID=2038116 RepID=A0A2K8T3H6_9NOSO|nr:hypothetical protein [Nostoc flagelliforme]AUB42221.1 hypothetical protein COO91_08333 [Nostoc flagelliforme CCNUN1]